MRVWLTPLRFVTVPYFWAACVTPMEQPLRLHRFLERRLNIYPTPAALYRS